MKDVSAAATFFFWHGLIALSASMFAFDWEAPVWAGNFGAFALWTWAILQLIVGCVYDQTTRNPDVLANIRQRKWMYSTPFWQFSVGVDLAIAGLVAGSGDYILATLLLVGLLLIASKQQKLRRHLEVF